jgi:hypothetical protein
MTTVELRLPAVKQIWASLAAQADKEGWPAGRFLAALAKHEIAERGLALIRSKPPTRATSMNGGSGRPSNCRKARC